MVSWSDILYGFYFSYIYRQFLDRNTDNISKIFIFFIFIQSNFITKQFVSLSNFQNIYLFRVALYKIYKSNLIFN